jgi:rare lipoprotein A
MPNHAARCLILLLASACAGATPAGSAAAPRGPGGKAAAAATGASAPARASASAHHAPDLSGRRRIGTASFYAGKFAGRRMADGERMDPADDNAASKTLPLGTKARVTHLETGRSAVVTIQDRGPHAKGRLIDLSPSTARRIGITRADGVAKVAVTPLAVPMPDGSVKRPDHGPDHARLRGPGQGAPRAGSEEPGGPPLDDRPRAARNGSPHGAAHRPPSTRR